jgi:UDP-N-acetylmuramoyl-L-alanyl-D-glutamate--2,6-diaminopimelate ligase
MKLSQILAKIKGNFEIVFNEKKIAEIEVEAIEIDSRLIQKNFAFFALPGKITDGVAFIESAVAKGASLVISSRIPQEFSSNSTTVFIKAENPFEILVECLQIFYPALPQNIYAITGTNGKTSTAEFTRQIAQFLGKKSASIGTLGIICSEDLGGQLHNVSLTTPDIVSLYKNLHILGKNGVTDVALEVSSIGLEQKRIAGLKIDVGSFTNFTQDHLDYHNSMAEYFRCKMLLFADVLKNGYAVLNADIPDFSEIKKTCEKQHHEIIEYGFKARDLIIKKIEKIDLGQKVSFEFKGKNLEFILSVAGDFQALNALCALGNILAKYELNENELQNLLQNFPKLQPAAGRMQRAGVLKNKAQVFIDFAHTPDALENVLKLARNLTKERVFVLFGCGGNRDAKKRPIMGEIACRLADRVIVTDDNPRNEDPQGIRLEILAACDMKKTLEISDRMEAIIQTISILEAGDILILAGKGHEKYQIIGDQKLKFDEEEIVRNVIGAAS